MPPTPQPLPPTAGRPHDWQVARWIWLPTSARPDHDFYRAVFSREIPVTGADRLRVTLTADALYELWINGTHAGNGPARGDLQHYRYETIERALDPSRRTLLLVVAVIPPHNALATGEIHAQPGLLLEAELLNPDGAVIRHLGTNADWQAAVDPSFTRNACDDAQWHLTPMGAAGYGELVDYRKHTAFSNRGPRAELPWHPATVTADPHDTAITGKTLEPSPLPRQQVVMQPLGTFFIPGQGDLCLPIDLGTAETVIFLDHGKLTTGYPRLIFRGGTGRKVRVTYCETLAEPTDQPLSHKNPSREIRRYKRHQMTERTQAFPMAYYDEIILGPEETFYQPSYLRTFRFLRIHIEPGEESAELTGTQHRFSAYPFTRRARFLASDESLRKIKHAAFRTTRLCAHDHFEDCPYYERLQYGGDTGLQALMSYYITGDLRLGLQAMEQLGWSRSPSHPRLTQARYPSRTPQTIPVFSLFWLTYAEDLIRFLEDLDPIRRVADRMVEVVQHFQDIETDGWLPDRDSNFIDWAWGHGLQGFRMPRTPEGYCSMVNLQAAGCLQSAARAFRRIERVRDADHAEILARTLISAVMDHARAEDGVILDGPGLTTRCQHSQIWAILTDALPADQQAALFTKTLECRDMVASSLYHNYFLFQAAHKVDQYEQVWPMIEDWRQLLREGFSTFPEEDGRHGFIRSDCHAWTAWPYLEFLRRILGIEVISPRRVLIRPRACGLKWARGSVPLGPAEIQVNWEMRQGQMRLQAHLPEGVEAEVRMPPGGEYSIL